MKIYIIPRNYSFSYRAGNTKVLFYRLADYQSEWRDKVEEYASKNPLPFSSWFNGNDRIYLPFAIQDNDLNVDTDIKEELESNGYKIIDYKKGICVDPQYPNNQVKIGKLLNKLKKKKVNELKGKVGDSFNLSVQEQIDRVIKYYDGLINQFNTSGYRSGSGSYSNLLIVISQNPHDVAQMSTGRRWTSCINLEEKKDDQDRVKDIFCEVEKGGIVAYLIRDEDKEIRDPIARVWIRRFDNPNGQSIAVPEEKVYGDQIPGFLSTVKSWVHDRQPSVPVDIYNRQGGEWSDTWKEEELVLPEDPKLIEDLYTGRDIISEDVNVSEDDITRKCIEKILFADKGVYSREIINQVKEDLLNKEYWESYRNTNKIMLWNNFITKYGDLLTLEDVLKDPLQILQHLPLVRNEKLKQEVFDYYNRPLKNPAHISTPLRYVQKIYKQLPPIVSKQFLDHAKELKNNGDMTGLDEMITLNNVIFKGGNSDFELDFIKNYVIPRMIDNPEIIDMYESSIVNLGKNISRELQVALMEVKKRLNKKNVGNMFETYKKIENKLNSWINAL
jgi:hypothetical protein